MSGATSKKVRESGIELLRIFAALGVVVLHYNDGRAFEYTAGVSREVLYFLESISICSVDVFIIISGYFLCTTYKREPLKIMDLFLERIFLKITLFLVFLFTGTNFSMGRLLEIFIPASYFIVLYSVLYFCSPFINKLIHGFAMESWIVFISMMVFIFSIWNTGADLLEEIIGQQFLGLSTVGAWGSQQGFTIVNFCLIYCIGAFLRYLVDNGKEKDIKTSVLVGIGISCSFIIYFWSVFTENLTRTELRSSWVYHNPVVILLAMMLFLIFKRIRIKSSIINELSKAAFTCYIFHGNILDYFKIEKYSGKGGVVMLLHIAFVCMAIYFLSWIIYEIWNLLSRPFMRMSARYKIFQPKMYGGGGRFLKIGICYATD